MSQLKCVIFDMDGTLTQTNKLIFDSFNFIVQKYQGKTMSEKEITALFGPPEEGAIVPIVGEEKRDEAMKVYLDFYEKNHKKLAQLYPGIRDILTFLKQRKISLALFTGKGTHTTRITLREFELEPLFDYVVTGNDVVNHKPSSEGITKILNHFRLKPDEVLMIGDSVSDVKASRDAGVKVAAVLWDSYGKEDVLRLKTDYLFHNVGQLDAWLRGQLD